MDKLNKNFVTYACRIFHSEYSVLLKKRCTHRVLLFLSSSLDRFFSKKVADHGNQLISLLRQSNNLQKNALTARGEKAAFSLIFMADESSYLESTFVFMWGVCVCVGRGHNSVSPIHFPEAFKNNFMCIMCGKRTCLNTHLFASHLCFPPCPWTFFSLDFPTVLTPIYYM
ncbi:Lim Domain Kinase 1 [Manis pentadactyla]|nr:Lim Domain Kinase 1 [Manis pentadactyla]